MDITTFIILVIIIVIAIVISFFIEDKTYKIYYYLILALGFLTFLNCYLGIIYYIKLRNEPGIPGPRGPKGDKGPSGSKGKCVLTDKCGFNQQELDSILYSMAAQTFQTNEKCIKSPSLKNCNGGAQEVERLQPVSDKLKHIENLALKGSFTKQELREKITNSLGNI
jgi:hypothetical protein